MFRVPMIFPGQASQFAGMAKDLASRPGPAADFLAGVDDCLGEPLTRIMFEGPVETLTETRNAQPAILAHSVAVVLALRDLGVEPSIVAGHSLGEFSAAVAAGALDPADGLRIVRRRGDLMFASGRERPGTMAAVVGLTAEAVTAVCRDVSERAGVVCLANDNSASQAVISGEVEAVAAAGEALREAGAKRVIPLTVSGAFHSPLLADAGEAFSEYLQRVRIHDARVPVVANVTARPVTTAADLIAGFRKQLTSPVRWQECLQGVLTGTGTGDSRPAVVLEVGPGRVLSNLARRAEPSVKFLPVGNLEELDKVLDILTGSGS